MSWLAILTLIPLFAALANRRNMPLHLVAALGVVTLLFGGSPVAAGVLWASMLVLALIPLR